MLEPGTKIGPYEITGALGAGGMGEVYRARDTKLGRDVAVKVLPKSFAQDEGRVARFEREARAVAALSHPNILAIYDFGREDGHVFAVMELLEGETLRERLALGALPARKAVEYGAQMARGLAAAHEKSITHRDLKPDNLFITHDGRLKIFDFGLATEAVETEAGGSDSSAPTRAAVTDPGVVLGTVGYMSPEQVRGERVDHRSDIFAFGSILYEMLTARRAFQRDTGAETMAAILKDEPPEMSGLDGAPLPALERIVHRCLEKKRGERFQSAYDLAFAIESISRESGPARKESATLRPRARSIITAALALLLAVGMFWLGRVAGGPDNAPPLSYERLTFRRGTVYAAQFEPGGRDVIYTAAWDGRVPEIYSTLPGARAARALGFPSSDVLSVSPSGEMASLRKTAVLGWENSEVTGTLALSTGSGGAAREISEDVVLADWTADGEQLVVVRLINRRRRVELPIGTVLYETTNWVNSLRVSPQGDVIAFGERATGYSTNQFIVFLEINGATKRFDTGIGGPWLDLAWSPDGDEVWFNTYGGGDPDLHAMSRTGKVRLLARSAVQLRILDVAPDGRVVVARTNFRGGVMGIAPGETVERDFSWLGDTGIRDISGDGRTLLLSELGSGGEGGSVYLRNVDGSPGLTWDLAPAVHLGEGEALDLSPDGKWALTLRRGEPGSLVLLPTGPGTPIVVENETIVDFVTASFISDENEIVFAGSKEGGALRWFRQAVPSGEPRPITGEVQWLKASANLGRSPVSPDGSMLAALKDEVIALYPMDGGEPRTLDDVPASMAVIRFTRDGRFLYVAEKFGRSVKVYRVDIETGRRELWKTIAPSDPAGLHDIYAVQISDNDESYYYTFDRMVSDLYLVEGLR
ncbi:MAG: serine/threonine protein kinase [Acidobacteria bacterium]|nr:MAG: serine/threonine protein kinase [Acidobacteriota bacterium]